MIPAACVGDGADNGRLGSPGKAGGGIRGWGGGGVLSDSSTPEQNLPLTLNEVHCRLPLHKSKVRMTPAASEPVQISRAEFICAKQQTRMYLCEAL